MGERIGLFIRYASTRFFADSDIIKYWMTFQDATIYNSKSDPFIENITTMNQREMCCCSMSIDLFYRPFQGIGQVKRATKCIIDFSIVFLFQGPCSLLCPCPKLRVGQAITVGSPETRIIAASRVINLVVVAVAIAGRRRTRRGWGISYSSTTAAAATTGQQNKGQRQGKQPRHDLCSGRCRNGHQPGVLTFRPL